MKEFKCIDTSLAETLSKSKPQGFLVSYSRVQYNKNIACVSCVFITLEEKLK
jgi:hypothetical protein